jgi:Uma2 family endonuclease
MHPCIEGHPPALVDVDSAREVESPVGEGPELYWRREEPVPLTAEELLARRDLGRAELVRGELVMMSPSGGRHGKLTATVAFILRGYAAPRGLGEVCGAETGFLVGRNPDTVRAPDAAFVAAARVPAGGAPDSYWPFAPDLAVEIVSPNDRWVDVEEKVRMWLESGTRFVWVVDPRGLEVHVHRPGAAVVKLRGDDSLDGGDVICGLSVPVRELFA